MVFQVDFRSNFSRLNCIPGLGVIDVIDGAVSVAAAVPPAQLVVLPLALVVARGRSHADALL